MEFGFAVESWRGYRDQGPDAYSQSPASSRSRNTTVTGPVVFQTKFVSEANARGSNYKRPLLSACDQEAAAIKERIVHGLWKDPESYILITNCPATAKDRDDIIANFEAETVAKVSVLGADDLADSLDLSPEIARAFPQIRSYRKLVNLIATIQAKDVLKRTAAALAGAQEIIPVFVPTEAYERAWAVLRSRSFVVLFGPPEMGKTSIGWMFAMTQVANGWQVIQCSTPADVFKVYKSK